MSIASSEESGKVVIKLPGQFDYKTQADFRQTYEAYPSTSLFTIDFSDVTYLDSSSLGMLLLLRDHLAITKTDDLKKKIQFINCGSKVQSIFRVSNFYELFIIE